MTLNCDGIPPFFCGNVHPSQTSLPHFCKTQPMNTESLVSALDDFLRGSSNAVVVEDNSQIFDLAEAKYSVSGDANRCLLHLWSAEKNVVRRVLEIETRHDTLKVTVQRMGHAKPSRLEIYRQRDRRTATAKKQARSHYRYTLERALKRRFPDLTLIQLSTSVDLEKSFGPIYARGMLRRGQSAFAVLGVNREELQGSIDAALTFGILWLDVCRHSGAGKFHVEV